MTASTNTLPAEGSLTALDRCDRCSAQALVQIRLPGGNDLLFCAHHYAGAEVKLASIAATVEQDIRGTVS